MCCWTRSWLRWLSGNHRGSVSAERAEASKQRVRALGVRGEEMARRLARLRAGEGATAADVQGSRSAADAAVLSSAVAHDRAAVAHRRAAMAHGAAAILADRFGNLARADEHRAAAVADEAAGDREAQLAEGTAPYVADEWPLLAWTAPQRRRSVVGAPV